MKRRSLFVIGHSSLVILFSGCASGHYAGPSLGLAVGYQGISLGLTLFGAADAAAPKPVAPASSSTMPVNLAAPDGKNAVPTQR